MSEILTQNNLVEIKHLKEYFNVNVGFFKTKPLKAVDDVFGLPYEQLVL